MFTATKKLLLVLLAAVSLFAAFLLCSLTGGKDNSASAMLVADCTVSDGSVEDSYTLSDGWNYAQTVNQTGGVAF